MDTETSNDDNGSRGNGDLTDSMTRVRIINRLKDTGDVDDVLFRENGTADMPDDLTNGIDRQVPALHIKLSSPNVTDAVMRVLGDEGLSMTPLTPTEVLADSASEGEIWGLSAEMWALLVDANEFYSSLTHKEAFALAKEMAEDDDDNYDEGAWNGASSIPEYIEKIDESKSVVQIFTSKLTDDQYDALVALAEDVDLVDIRDRPTDELVHIERTKPGQFGTGLYLRDVDVSEVEGVDQNEVWRKGIEAAKAEMNAGDADSDDGDDVDEELDDLEDDLDNLGDGE